LKTASFVLMELINKANLTSVQGTLDARAATYAAQTFTAETIRMATMIVVVIPIVCVYPFLQKYFVKGMLLGSIKG
jgi:putative aldouronate transport system permease protein